jgi:hypothetical protein
VLIIIIINNTCSQAALACEAIALCFPHAHTRVRYDAVRATLASTRLVELVERALKAPWNVTQVSAVHARVTESAS